MKAGGYVVFAWMVFLLAAGQSAASPISVQIELVSGPCRIMERSGDRRDLAPFSNMHLSRLVPRSACSRTVAVLQAIHGL